LITSSPVNHGPRQTSTDFCNKIRQMLIFGSLLALIGVILIAVALLCANQYRANYSGPNRYQAQSSQGISSSGAQNPQAATEDHKEPNSAVNSGFKTWVVSNEKFLNAVSTAFIAMFTVLLAFGSIALFCATRNLVTGAQDTAQRQLRAYVGLGADDFGFDTPSENDPAYTPIDPANPVAGQIYKDFLTIKVKNFGQTPAYDVIVFGYVTPITPFAGMLPDDFFTRRVPLRDVIPTAPIRPFTSRFILQPEQTAVSKHAVLDVREISAARQKQTSIYVWGRIYYRDIYDRPWRTLFCYVWEPWHPPGARFVPYETYNGEDQTPIQ
jgi:hypothetical protein